jgi:perosamine synthetase
VTIPISKPYFGPEERNAIVAPLESGWVVQGPFVATFEQQFAAFVGSPFAAATSSCTTALHLAVASLGLRPGDEVIVPAFTWVATANVVEHMGATPVFCDVDLRTFNMNVEHMEAVMTSRTVGVIPVHLFGLCAPIRELVAAASRHKLWVVEDAACAFGARVGGRHAGTFGDIGCFSFHPRKAITTGEGGMVTTPSPDTDRLVRSLRDHGASRTDLARHTGQAGYLLAEYDLAGYNYRMTDLQGALGCAQMNRAAWFLHERRRVARTYDQLLTRFEWLDRPATPPGYEHGYQSYACLFRPEPPSLDNVHRLHARRNQVMDRLERRGIATRQGTHAPVLTGYYAGKYGLRPEQFPNAVIADRISLSLPMYVQLTDSDLHQVCDALGEAIDA